MLIEEKYRGIDPTKPIDQWDVFPEPLSDTERRIGFIVVSLVIGLLVAGASAFLDQRFYVADDERRGANYGAALAPGTRIDTCWAVADKEYGEFGRDKLVFLHGCTGRWYDGIETGD